MTTWTYPRCIVTGVHDGDTLSVDIDLGQEIWIRSRPVRLAGIAARELRLPGGKEARDHLAALLPVGTVVRVDSQGWDKYGGRIDGSIVRLPDGMDVSAAMVADGYAVDWDGKGAQPLPPWPLPV